MELKDLSSAALRERRRQLALDMPPVEEVMRGTLRATFLRCGRPNCHYASGPGHGPKHYPCVQGVASRAMRSRCTATRHYRQASPSFPM